MLLGIAAGGGVHAGFSDPATHSLFAGYVSIGSTIFLRLIKMIIAPLVFSTLVVGIGHMSDAGAVGRVGGKAMLWFISASLVSLTLGLILVNLFAPGDGVHKVVSGLTTGIDAHAMSLDGFIKHVFPDSAIRPMVDNEILQIVVFSMFFGVACAAMGERAKIVLEGIEGLSHIILRVTGYVMKLAPVAVFCAMAATIATNGLGILVNYAKFMGEFYFGLVCLWLVLIVVGFGLLGPAVMRLARLVQEPFLLAFSTASSEAAYPKMLEQLAKFPISSKISSFVLPLGYSFNLDGTMMYCTFASVFIAQADRHVADPDVDQQRRRRCAPGLAGGDCRDAQPVQPPRGGTAAHPWHRHLPRHGPLRNQRHRQLSGHRGGRQMGRPTRQ
jgi:Na+/H+-dicarboxylate symporter